MTGNDPLNDPENFDWETWEDNQIADVELKRRRADTVRNRLSWRGVNELGNLWGVLQAEQSWNNRAAAEEALQRDAWTQKEPAQKQARGARR